MCVCARVGELAPVRSGRSSRRSRNWSEQPGSFRHGAGGLPRRDAASPAKSIYYPCRCFCQAFATGEPEDTAIPAPDAAAALVGAPFIQAFVHHCFKCNNLLDGACFLSNCLPVADDAAAKDAEAEGACFCYNHGFIPCSASAFFPSHFAAQGNTHACMHACMHARVRCHLSRWALHGGRRPGAASLRQAPTLQTQARGAATSTLQQSLILIAHPTRHV